MSWDGHGDSPAVAVPLGDFFCQGWGEYAQLLSEPMVVAPYGGMNCYFPMPFRTSARLSLENLGPSEQVVYYQVDYAWGDRGRSRLSARVLAPGEPPAGRAGAYGPRRSSRSRYLRWHLSGRRSERSGLVGRGGSQVFHR